MERWAYFFKHADETHEKDVSKIMGLLPPIERAYEELNRFNWDEIEMNTYEEREKRDRDRRAIEAYKMQQIEEKIQKIEEAYEKKIAKGIAQGMEKGREEGREEEKIEIARNLLKLGLTLESISQATGLDLPTLKKL
jgi:predicted transposase/invertase (TIGR01784 family)